MTIFKEILLKSRFYSITSLLWATRDMKIKAIFLDFGPL